MLCGFPVLANTRNYDNYDDWLAATQQMSFEKVTTDLMDALEVATDSEALDVLVEIGAAITPPQKRT